MSTAVGKDSKKSTKKLYNIGNLWYKHTYKKGSEHTNTSLNLIAHILKFRLKHHLVDSVKAIISSNSMEPYILKGDTVLIVYCELYEVGDVIAYVHWEKSITIHRIVRKDNNRIYTKGDNNLTEDDYHITKENIIGKVIVLRDA